MKLFVTMFLLSGFYIYFVRAFRQEGAVINQCNPKYVTNCTAITKRVNRGAPYLTNISCQSLVQFNNNVTVSLIVKDATGIIKLYDLKYKLCSVFIDVNWTRDYIKKFSNMPSECPVPAGYYIFRNIELPPKDKAVPIPKGNLQLSGIIEVTNTHEIILEMSVKLHQ